MKYYAAYGSNTPQEMKYRCSDARFLGKATLKGYRLAFTWYATIEPSVSDEIEVMLYKISDEDEIKLDYYEGYPSLYEKFEVSVDFEGEIVQALIYRMKRGKATPCLPEQEYFLRCAVGYRYSKIPFKQLENAVSYTAHLMLENQKEEG